MVGDTRRGAVARRGAVTRLLPGTERGAVGRPVIVTEARAVVAPSCGGTLLGHCAGVVQRQNISVPS